MDDDYYDDDGWGGGNDVGGEGADDGGGGGGGLMCPNCGSNQIESQEASGSSVCISCGVVVEENAVVNAVEYVEGAGGTTGVVGQFVSATRSKAYSGAGGGRGRGYGFSRDSRENTLANGRRKIQEVASRLRLGPTFVDAAHRLYTVAVEKNFVMGRRSSHVIAACLYIACRQEKSQHMLIDFSDAMQVNVYTLGTCFLKFRRLLGLKLEVVDPALYVYRFAAHLDLDEKANAVALTALRLVGRMKRDWIVVGRRPAGICAAALLIAARAHGFSKHEQDVTRILRVCGLTVNTRVKEFENTASASLTLEQFNAVDLEQEADPPRFTINKIREARAKAIQENNVELLESGKLDNPFQSKMRQATWRKGASTSRRRKETSEGDKLNTLYLQLEHEMTSKKEGKKKVASLPQSLEDGRREERDDDDGDDDENKKSKKATKGKIQGGDGEEKEEEMGEEEDEDGEKDENEEDGKSKSKPNNASEEIIDADEERAKAQKDKDNHDGSGEEEKEEEKTEGANKNSKSEDDTSKNDDKAERKSTPKRHGASKGDEGDENEEEEKEDKKPAAIDVSKKSSSSRQEEEDDLALALLNLKSKGGSSSQKQQLVVHDGNQSLSAINPEWQDAYPRVRHGKALILPDHATAEERQASTVPVECSLSLTEWKEDIPDSITQEVDSMFRTEEEMLQKEAIFNKVNKDYIENEERKRLNREAEEKAIADGEVDPEQLQGAARYNKKRKKGVAGTTEEALLDAINSRKVSRKINYDAMSSLFGDDGGFSHDTNDPFREDDNPEDAPIEDHTDAWNIAAAQDPVEEFEYEEI